MTGRELLGPADVDDAVLAAMAADLLGHDHADVELQSSAVAEVAYDLPAITTAGRYWVSGVVTTPSGPASFRLFVKHVQAWHRHPFFQQVPVEMRPLAAASVPWRTEPLAYRSDLGDRLPDGLHMPRALGVFDLDEHSAAIWLEEVTGPPVAWDLDRYRRAAFLLGRLAASSAVAERRDVGEFTWTVADYARGRVAVEVAPVLLAEDSWRHPALAAFDTDLRRRLREAAEDAAETARELLGFPVLSAHGDASPNNLLPGPRPDSFTLIDYGFWMPNPVGFDLGQLLVGEVQVGRRSPDLLAETDEAIVAAYHDGLAAEGLRLPLADLRRAHALHLVLFTAVSAVPFDQLHLAAGPLERLARERATLARYCLDLLDATR